jgi:Protein of unknown function (DUF2892)
MLRNIGIIDQVVRGILGIAFVAIAAQDGSSIAVVALSGLAAAYLLATAIVLYCPLYALLGLSTYGPLDRST